MVYVVWGSTFLAIRIGIRDLPPATFAGARYLLAGALLLPVALRSGGPELRASDRPGRREWLGCAVVGVLLLSVGNGGVTLAERHLDSGFAALIAATIPLWMILLGAAAARRRPRRRDVLGLVIGFGGVTVLAGRAGADHPGSLVIALVAAAGWGLGSVLAGRVTLPRRPLLAAALQLGIGGCVLLALGGVRGEWTQVHPSHVGAGSWVAFAWLVVPGSIVAFSAYGYALGHLPLGIVSTYAYVNPVVAVLLGAVVLDERIGWNEAVGAVLVVSSVVVTLLGPRTAGPAPAASRAGTDGGPAVRDRTAGGGTPRP